MSHAAHTYQWGVTPETLKANIDKIAEGNLKTRVLVEDTHALAKC
jgi:hypothetical protein